MKPKKFNKKLLELVRTANELPDGCTGIVCEQCFLRSGDSLDICALLKSRMPSYKS